MHHLHHPRRTVKIFFDQLKSGGVYFGEEGIISSAFAYPASIAWQYQCPEYVNPEEGEDGIDRDGDFGMKLIYHVQKIGFEIKLAKLQQPLFYKQEDKARLMAGHLAFKKTMLEQGLSEEDWQKQTKALEQLIDDDFSTVAFYQSMQMAGIKS